MSRGDRLLLAATLAIPAITLIQAVTYDAWADGPAADHARAGLLALTISCVAWLAVRATVPPRPRIWIALPWTTAVLVLLPSNALHYQRILHPIARTGVLAIQDGFDGAVVPDPATWTAEVRGDASAVPAGGALTLTSQPGGAAFVDLRTPGRPSASDAHFLPRGLLRDDYDERLRWEASLRPVTSFSVVLETRQLLVQATQFGLHLTYPNVQGSLTEHHVERPDLKDGQVRTYLLERNGGLIRLRINNEPSWVYPDAGRFEIVRFGETRPDPSHAGTLTLHSARYERSYPRG